MAATLWAGLLPGCHNLDSFRNSDVAEPKTKTQTPAVSTPSTGTAAVQTVQTRIDVIPPAEPPRIQIPLMTVEPPVPSPDQQAPRVVSALPVTNRVEPKPPPDPEVVSALKRLIERRPAEAQAILSHYDGEPNQHTLWHVLNIAGRIHEKGMDGLSPEEVCTIQKSLHDLGLIFQSRAPLHISQMFFFESGRVPGESKPLAPGHVFRVGDRDRPGELVQLHVEYRNLEYVEQPDKTYRTDILRYVEISDPSDKSGRPLWKKFLDNGKKTLYLSVRRTEFDTNYTFYVPANLPAGNLMLTVTVEDWTRPDHPRVARRSLEFCVNNQSERGARP
jgi:hypothetical protein